MSISLIRLALNNEREAVPKCSIFKILKVTTLPYGVLLDVQPKYAYGHTPTLDDEKFSGADATWYSEPKGCSAKVKHIIPKNNQIILGGLKGTLPQQNQDIWLYPKDFIQPLLECWSNDEWATQAFACLDDLAHPKRVESATLTGHHFKHLRSAQLQALSLVNQSSSFLWGPPGTGKTTTLGALIAEYLYANPFARVLLVSTTNRAVDEATIAVDKALEQAKLTALRRTIQRHGSRFAPHRYAGRQHLLPKALRNITRFDDATTPDGGSGSPPDQDLLQDGAASNVRLRTMTITQAVTTMAKLKSLPPFDLLVFDEASQISLARSLIVMPLGKARLFAGDPMQLAPITQSPSLPVRLWLKKSVFAHMPPPGPSVCVLAEQSRMAPPICDIVSEVFYGDCNLRVAQAELNNRQWLKDRTINFGLISRNKHVHIQGISSDGVWTQENRGWSRLESADWIVRMVNSALHQHHVAQEDILIVTPFHAQRKLISEALHRDNLKKIKVSTIYSEQGGEALVVIFDPVNGCHSMSSGIEGLQSVNVALSRAKAKLILTLSKGDKANPVFDQIDVIVARHADREPKPIAEVLSHPQYITQAIGQRVDINGQVGEITEFSRDGAIMWLVVESTGAEITLSTDTLRATSMRGEVTDV